jgi:DNA-binding NarL/FixJ family response regulator
MQKKVLVCEDHTIVADGLKYIIEKSLDFVLCGHARTQTESIELLLQKKPQVLLLDLNLNGEDGFSVLKEANRFPEILVLILTMYRDEFLISRAKKLGANGYLEKTVSNEELLLAMGRSTHDSFFLSRSLRVEAESRRSFRSQFANKMKLTNREMELVPLLADGRTAQEIADLLFLSHHTIETHRKNIFKKLQINSLVDLVNFVHENKLV